MATIPQMVTLGGADEQWRNNRVRGLALLLVQPWSLALLAGVYKTNNLLHRREHGARSCWLCEHRSGPQPFLRSPRTPDRKRAHGTQRRLGRRGDDLATTDQAQGTG
jgi:hypothetical protein